MDCHSVHGTGQSRPQNPASLSPLLPPQAPRMTEGFLFVFKVPATAQRMGEGTGLQADSSDPDLAEWPSGSWGWVGNVRPVW